ncbi:MAG: CDP-alcohol phosphatidyltransferase family protein [Rubellimicrobium sp.]|nr:CDP-alcohol phosphatidyltransferase family protein [Rubellimicrobium sp.]
MVDLNNRRPLASRDSPVAQRVARWLAGTGVTPNAISIAGMGAALIAGSCFLGAGLVGGGWQSAALIVAAAGCQLRLLCNLFDGMVAVEAGRAAPDGGFWNEFPDRMSDLMILVGLGLGLGEPALGWAATGFAFLTAYVRELGVNLGQPADYAGPMAKQHRMALVTMAALLAALQPIWGGAFAVLHVALWIVTVGAALTALHRAGRLLRRLRP